jgi:large subunit ribosomal protein L22
MGQQKKERREEANEAKASVKYLRTSPQKLNLVAATIRGKDAGKALVDLEFNNRRIAKDVRKVLQSAVANAENNHGLDVDKLYVAEAFVGKSIVMKRFATRARGRSSRILKPFSRLTVIVRERDSAVTAKPVKAKAAPKAEKAEKPAAAPKKPAAKKTPAKKAAAKKEVKE